MIKCFTRLYPPVKVTGKSFKGVKVITVPDQSMSLADILKRFIRKESLPVAREGFYSEELGDVEKMQKQDLSVIHDRGIELRDRMAKEKADAAAKAKADADAAYEAGIQARVDQEISRRTSADRPGGPVLTSTS